MPAAWTERRRLFELRSLARSIAELQRGFHLLAGDFNILAPGGDLDLKRLPHAYRERVVTCEVVRAPEAVIASGHLPVVADLAID